MPGFTGDLDVDLERGLAECGLAVETAGYRTSNVAMTG